MAIQLDLFFPADELSTLRQELLQTKTELGNVRRGMFSRFNEMGKRHIAVMGEIESLRVEIARLKADSRYQQIA